MTSKKSLARMMLGTAVAAMSIGAIAQDKSVELKFAHWLPGSHPLAKLGFEPWAKSVEAASNGSIKVALFPAQQLGKAAVQPDQIAQRHHQIARDEMPGQQPCQRGEGRQEEQTSQVTFEHGNTWGGSDARSTRRGL